MTALNTLNTLAHAAMPVFEPDFIATPAAEPVEHTNLIGIVTRTSWLRRHKGPVQEALDRLAGKAVTRRRRLQEDYRVPGDHGRGSPGSAEARQHAQPAAGRYWRVCPRQCRSAAPGGQDYAHELVNRPQVFTDDVQRADGMLRKRVHFGGRAFHFAGWYFQKAMFVAIMTVAGSSGFRNQGRRVRPGRRRSGNRLQERRLVGLQADSPGMRSQQHVLRRQAAG